MELHKYGMEIGSVVRWQDADDNCHVGIAIDAIPESDGEGHIIILENDMDGIDEIPPVLITSFVNPSGVVHMGCP